MCACVVVNIVSPSDAITMYRGVFLKFACLAPPESPKTRRGAESGFIKSLSAIRAATPAE